MSIVSAELGYNVVRRSGARKGAVQYSPAALGEKEPPPYSVNPRGETVEHWMRSFTRRPIDSLNTTTHGTDVPLKCDQYGSHAHGASLFDADVPTHTEALKIEDPTVGIYPDHHYGFVDEFVPASIHYDNLMQGLRPDPRFIILNQPVSEPAPAEFRPEHFSKGHYKNPKGVNFDIGMYGLNPIA